MTPPAAAASSLQRGTKLAPPRPRPRRVSGPAQPLRRPRPAAKPAPASGQDGLVVGLLGAVEALSTHRLLDRLIRGRMWIGLVAFALIGIVTLQLGLLKLNSGIGRAIERTAKLQTENAALSIENSELASGDRVESQAQRLGMKLVSIDGLHFLSSHSRSDVGHAAAALREPLRPASESAGTSPEATSAPTESSTEASTESSTASSGTEHEASETPAGSSTESSTSTPSEAPASSSSESEAPAAGSGEAAAAGAGGGTASPAG